MSIQNCVLITKAMETCEMQTVSRTKIMELQSIITKMPLAMCCVTVLPEFGLRWGEVSRAVRGARLPMCGASVARVVCRAAARLPPHELHRLVPRLRLHLVAAQDRTWHVIKLCERETEDPVALLTQYLPSRIKHALRNGRKNLKAEVETILLGDLVYLSVRAVSGAREGPPLYVATPPGSDAALVSSLASVAMLRAVVQGLGYKEYVNANLHGQDINSLLRIINKNHNENVEHLNEVPEYQPMPVITKNGIDYTNKTYDEQYVEQLLGPDPPVLTDLTITSAKSFFDRSKLNKMLSLKVQLKSENIADTLKGWVVKGALAPTSDFFQIFHRIKSNKIDYNKDSD